MLLRRRIQMSGNRGSRKRDDVTFTAKGLGRHFEGLCQICAAPVLGCPLSDGCPASKLCPDHFIELHDTPS